MAVGNEVILQLCATAQAPCRDYHGLIVTDSQVILNTWNISYGPHVYPKRQRSTLENFPEARCLQNDIKRIFGEHAVRFCLHLATNDRNLQYLPTKLFLRILRYLAAQDILSLSQTSKVFFELCNTDTVWKIIYGNKIKCPMTREDFKTVENVGWKKTLMNKLSKKIDVNKLLYKKSSIQCKYEKNNYVRKTSILHKHSIDVIQNIKGISGQKIMGDIKGPFKISQLHEGIKTPIIIPRINSARQAHHENNNQVIRNIKSSYSVTRMSSARQPNNPLHKTDIGQINTKSLNLSQSHGKTVKLHISGDSVMNNVNNAIVSEKIKPKGILKNSTRRK